MPGEIAIASELLMTFIQAWMLYQKEKGLTDEQINESFTTTFAKFMAISAVPVNPVME